MVLLVGQDDVTGMAATLAEIGVHKMQALHLQTVASVDDATDDGPKYRISRVRRYTGVSRMVGRCRTDNSFKVLAAPAA